MATARPPLAAGLVTWTPVIRLRVRGEGANCGGLKVGQTDNLFAVQGEGQQPVRGIVHVDGEGGLPIGAGLDSRAQLVGAIVNTWPPGAMK
jgi:hypothetical protein